MAVWVDPCWDVIGRLVLETDVRQRTAWQAWLRAGSVIINIARLLLKVEVFVWGSIHRKGWHTIDASLVDCVCSILLASFSCCNPKIPWLPAMAPKTPPATCAPSGAMLNSEQKSSTPDNCYDMCTKSTMMWTGAHSSCTPCSLAWADFEIPSMTTAESWPNKHLTRKDAWGSRNISYTVRLTQYTRMLCPSNHVGEIEQSKHTPRS
jgi:hypothetical protein